ncbi:MAG: 3-phosphoshikimate 1-carboxyvinyltransferase [Candidatus Saelkia tenebricola]|nr:3-phosphoshikimate 1-carboxyvinyltransferase [Candidatus Saelkia tenebricola]
MKITGKSGLSFDSYYSPPADKSISHRSVFFSSLSSNAVKIRNFLFSEDCLSTVKAFQALGVNIDLIDERSLEVSGVGLKGLKAPLGELYLGNSGTTARLITGLLSAQSFETVLIGDNSLSRRPMARVIQPLRLMGADIRGEDNDNLLPVRIKGGKLKGVEYELPVASAQVKSALLIAGMYAKGKTIIHEPFKSRDHTERMLKAFEADIKIEGLKTEISFVKQITAQDMFIPGDISSAAFFIALCLLSSDSRLVIKNVGLNPTRLGFIDVLKRMGGEIEVVCKVKEEESEIYEPYGDIIVTSSTLNGINVKKEEIPRMIDELPILFLIASLAKGETYIEGVSELRLKETDRINSMLVNLKNMGAEMEVDIDNIKIRGIKRFKSASLCAFSDHRTAMVSIIAALVSKGDFSIDNLDCIKISYPDFLLDVQKILGDI